MPSTNEAARLYAEGLSKLRLFEAREARSLLEKAATLDPKFALGHAALSEALTNLGYDALAREEAQKAFDLSASLSRDERLMIEGRLREATREWPKAVETYRTLWRFFPDNLEYGLRLAAAQTAAGQPKEALATVEEMRRATDSANGDPRIDLAEAKAYDKLGSFKQSLAAAQTAGKIGEANGARKSSSCIRRIRHDLFSAAGDKRGAATATHLNGHLLYDQGNYAEANRTYQTALAVFRETGDQQSAAATLNNLGNVANDIGDFPKAMSYYEQTLAIDRETGSKGGMAGALGNMANVFDSMGDLANARKKNEEGLAMFREVGDQRGTASTLGNLGNVLVEIGELTAARQHYEEGLKIQKETGYRRGQAYALSNLADLLTVTGDFPEAPKLAEQALALRRELGENTNVAISQLQMGWIAFNEARLNEAEASLRDAAQVFQKSDMRDLLISCNALMARVLLAQGKTAEAERLAADAVQMAKSRPSRPPQFDAALALAAVEMAERKFGDAAKAGQEALNLASRYGYTGYQMELRLMLTQLLARSGKTSQARVQAASLQRDARAKGYGRIEREAAKLAGR